MEERKPGKREEKDEEDDFYDCHETLEQTQEPETFTETRTGTRTETRSGTGTGTRTETRRTFCELTEERETREEGHKELTEGHINERLQEETGQGDSEGAKGGDSEGAKGGDSEGAKGGDEERTQGCTEEVRDKMEDLKVTDSVTEKEFQECSEGGAVCAEEASGEREELLQEASGEREELQEEEEVQMDEEYLRELEKDLTDEEKEMRREQSLDLKDRGNTLFKNQQWSEACGLYTEALSLCPVSFSKDRAVLFNNRAAARTHLDQKDKAILDCSKALQLNPDYLKALLRRAELYEQTEKLDEALDDFNKVLERDPHNTSARHASQRLPPLIHQRNEKLKEEMMSKLKDLGNLILRPFGLSTNNFQLNQDQTTGAYNINFVQSPGNNNR